MPLPNPPQKFVHIFFMDGVGLGSDDPQVNPFATASLPNLTGLLGEGWYLRPESGGQPRRHGPRASLSATDPNLEMAGRPQSATGQAAILTGRNVPQIIGQHYGPKPNPAVAAVIKEGSLFQEVVTGGGKAALITPYPEQYFEAINSGRRLLSSVPLAASSAGISLMTVDDLRAGRAVSPGFTGEGWRSMLGYDDIPLLTLPQSGRQIARLSQNYHFSFFEHWPSDRSGHRGSLEAAREHLETIDIALGGLFEAWDDDRGLLIITSDHGNIEEKDHRQHSRNPVPTIVMGPGHAEIAAQIDYLTDIAPAVREYLALDADY